MANHVRREGNTPSSLISFLIEGLPGRDLHFHRPSPPQISPFPFFCRLSPTLSPFHSLSLYLSLSISHFSLSQYKPRPKADLCSMAVQPRHTRHEELQKTPIGGDDSFFAIGAPSTKVVVVHENS